MIISIAFRSFLFVAARRCVDACTPPRHRPSFTLPDRRQRNVLMNPPPVEYVTVPPYYRTGPLSTSIRRAVYRSGPVISSSISIAAACPSSCASLLHGTTKFVCRHWSHRLNLPWTANRRRQVITMQWATNRLKRWVNHIKCLIVFFTVHMHSRKLVSLLIFWNTWKIVWRTTWANALVFRRVTLY